MADRGDGGSSKEEGGGSKRSSSRLRFGVDENGDEVLEMAATSQGPARGGNRVVMMKWEEPYMAALVEALDLQGTDEVCDLSCLGYVCRASSSLPNQ